MGYHDLFFKKTFSIRENTADFLFLSSYSFLPIEYE